jgi:hypothetical protein
MKKEKEKDRDNTPLTEQPPQLQSQPPIPQLQPKLPKQEQQQPQEQKQPLPSMEQLIQGLVNFQNEQGYELITIGQRLQQASREIAKTMADIEKEKRK